jgi:hypothetical protein
LSEAEPIWREDVAAEEPGDPDGEATFVNVVNLRPPPEALVVAVDPALW